MRQHLIQDADIEFALQGISQTLITVSGRDDPMPGALQIGAEEVEDIFVILNNKYRCGRFDFDRYQSNRFPKEPNPNATDRKSPDRSGSAAI